MLRTLEEKISVSCDRLGHSNVRARNLLCGTYYAVLDRQVVSTSDLGFAETLHIDHGWLALPLRPTRGRHTVISEDK